MLVAGGMAYERGRREAEAEASSQQPQQEYAPAPPPPAPSSGGSETDEIARLAEMHAAGTLSDEEFAAAKAKLLGM
jgi:hypothetical protein